MSGAPPASGGWREGDPVGRRRFADVGAVDLERGGRLPAVRVAYETWGRPRTDPAGRVTNGVLVMHALTGDSHVSGEVEPGHPTPGWWNGLVGPGMVIDPARHFVVCPNVLGGCQGTTGPATNAPDGRPWGSRWPRTTIRDQVEVERLLAEQLSVARWQLVLGGSMGGMRALEWAAGSPDSVAALAVIASTGEASADQIGTQTTQIDVIRADPNWSGGDYHDAAPGFGPHVGLGLARRIAHLTYRSAAELDTRFGRAAQDATDSLDFKDPLDGGRWQVQSYLEHHGDKLAHRFDAGSYVALTEAMNSHDVGRGRGGQERALARITARTVVVGVDSDRLYPVDQQRRIADGLAPGVLTGDLQVLSSPFGHDGFLLERDAIAKAVSSLLD